MTIITLVFRCDHSLNPEPDTPKGLSQELGFQIGFKPTWTPKRLYINDSVLWY